MSWSELHTQSEKFATEAHLALRSGRSSDARNLYKQAAELEQKALDLLDVTKARTRGITAVSAVALWFKAGEYTLAEQLACSMLADSQIPAFAREELQSLVRAIWTESSKCSP